MPDIVISRKDGEKSSDTSLIEVINHFGNKRSGDRANAAQDFLLYVPREIDLVEVSPRFPQTPVQVHWKLHSIFVALYFFDVQECRFCLSQDEFELN